ncbi:hypothetical protein FRC07_002712 [Ceratobasidium sp. 392]|nr:hypothetical protein FRC07_002712 [Ceratobasidium sp. 392]
MAKKSAKFDVVIPTPNNERTEKTGEQAQSKKQSSKVLGGRHRLEPEDQTNEDESNEEPQSQSPNRKTNNKKFKGKKSQSGLEGIGDVVADGLLQNGPVEDSPDNFQQAQAIMEETQTDWSLNDILAHTLQQLYTGDQSSSQTAEMNRMERYNQYVLGVAHLSFDDGPYSVQHILPFDSQGRVAESHKINHRPLDMNHGRKLASVFSTLSNLRDYRSPIVLLLDEDAIESDCLAAMRGLDWLGIQTKTHPLKLKISEEEKRLARLARDRMHPDGKRLTQAEHEVMVEQLKTVREARRNWADLVNGHHRIWAMLTLSTKAVQKVKTFIQAVDEGDITAQAFERELAQWRNQLQMLKYRVIVLKKGTPQDIIAELAENHDPELQKGASHGEALWSMTEKIEGSVVRHMMNDPSLSREGAMNKARHERRKERGLLDAPENENVPKVAEVAKPKRGAAQRKPKAEPLDLPLAKIIPGDVIDLTQDLDVPVPPSESSSKSKDRDAGSREGKEVYLKMGAVAVLLEMVIASRSLFIVYENILKTDVGGAMLNRNGGMIAARIWLSLETLLKIADVPTAAHLKEAMEFVKQGRKVTYEGYQAAVEHWEKPRDRPSNIPPLKNVYTETVSDTFHKKFQDSGFRSTNAADWGDPWDEKNVVQLRNTFVAFGMEVINAPGASIPVLLFGVMCILYGHLPLAPKPRIERPNSDTETSQYSSERSHRFPVSNYFYPGAVLPHTRIFRAITTQYNEKLKLGEVHHMMDVLLERSQLIWTCAGGGSLTTTSHDTQAGNFYRSGYWPQSALLFLVEATHLGPIENRLVLAISLFDNPALVDALIASDEILRSLPTVSSLMVDCATNKKGVATYPILEQRVEEDPNFGDKDTFTKRSLAARTAIKEYAYQTGKYNTLDDLLKDQPLLLDVAPREYWDAMPLKRWIQGWTTGKPLNLSNTALGWVLFMPEYEKRVLAVVLADPRTRAAVYFAQAIWEVRKKLPWFFGFLDTKTLDIEHPREAPTPSPSPSESEPEDSHVSEPEPSQTLSGRTRSANGKLPPPVASTLPPSFKSKNPKRRATASQSTRASQASKAIKTIKAGTSKTGASKVKSKEFINSDVDSDEEPEEPKNANPNGSDDEGGGGDMEDAQGAVAVQQDSDEDVPMTSPVSNWADKGQERENYRGRPDQAVHMRDIVQPADAEWLSGFVKRTVPEELAGVYALSFDLLHNMGQHPDNPARPGTGMTQADIDFELRQRWQDLKDKAQTLMAAFGKHRRDLRQQLYHDVKAVLQGRMVLENVQFNLASQLRRTANIYPGITNHEAMAEVGRMVKSDGLLANELFFAKELRGDSDEAFWIIGVCLHRTFPRALQDQMADMCLIEVGRVPQLDYDWDHMSSLASTIHLMEGLGSTIDETNRRGVIASKAFTVDKSLPRAVFKNISRHGPQFPDDPNDRFSARQYMGAKVDPDKTVWANAGWECYQLPPQQDRFVNLPDISALSSGSLVPHFQEGDNLTASEQHRKNITREIEEMWTNWAEEHQNEYKGHLRDKFYSYGYDGNSGQEVGLESIGKGSEMARIYRTQSPSKQNSSAPPPSPHHRPVDPQSCSSPTPGDGPADPDDPMLRLLHDSQLRKTSKPGSVHSVQSARSEHSADSIDPYAVGSLPSQQPGATQTNDIPSHVGLKRRREERRERKIPTGHQRTDTVVTTSSSSTVDQPLRKQHRPGHKGDLGTA